MNAPVGGADNFLMKRTLGISVAALVLTAMLQGAVSQAANGTTCWSSTRTERAFATKMNGSRSGSNLGSVKLDPELSKVARLHTKEMIGAKGIYHTPMTKLMARVTNWVALGENVGRGDTVRSLHRAFMRSPSHRANILDGTYNHVGVGTARAGGKLWVSVVFEARTDPGTTLAMPNC